VATKHDVKTKHLRVRCGDSLKEGRCSFCTRHKADHAIVSIHAVHEHLGRVRFCAECFEELRTALKKFGAA
jgi:hypothetical protein